MHEDGALRVEVLLSRDEDRVRRRAARAAATGLLLPPSATIRTESPPRKSPRTPATPTARILVPLLCTAFAAPASSRRSLTYAGSRRHSRSMPRRRSPTSSSRDGGGEHPALGFVTRSRSTFSRSGSFPRRTGSSRATSRRPSPRATNEESSGSSPLRTDVMEASRFTQTRSSTRGSSTKARPPSSRSAWADTPGFT